MRCISEKAKIGSNVHIGYYVVIEDDVKIGNNCIIGNNVIIYKESLIGNSVRIDDNSVIGKKPLYRKPPEMLPPCQIGDECVVGTSVILYAGCTIGCGCMIADLSTIREKVTIGKHTIVGRGVSVENNCEIGAFCKLETNSYITAYSRLEDRAFIAPGVVTSNDNFAGRSEERYKHYKGVTVKEGGRIGANATILPGKTIDEQGFAAAGSVVTKDIPPRKIVAGNPARILKDVPKSQLLQNDTK
jgi:UDP-2-acetamido-3-amino-2,3-dideoxy-glucuronate N-acetyltransferase